MVSKPISLMLVPACNTRILKLVFALCGVFAGLAFAQDRPGAQEPSVPAAQTIQTPPATPDPIDVLLSAKTAIAVGDVGWREGVWLWGGPSSDKSQNRLEQELQRWGRFQVVSDVAEADLIMLLIEGTRQGSVLGGLGGRSQRVYSQLIVFKGGQLPKKFEHPLWQADEDAGMFSMSAAAKVVTRFRKHIEQLAQANPGRKQLADLPSSKRGAPTSAATAVTQATASAATPVETTLPGTPSPQPQAAVAPSVSLSTGPETTRTPTAFDPLERMRNAKTVAIMVTAPRAKASLGDKVFGLASEEKAGAIVQQELSVWNRFTLVDDPRSADLVFAAYEWNEPSIGSHVLNVDTIEVYEGGAALDRDDPPLWTSGAWMKSMREQVRDIRNEIERDPKQIQTVSNPDAKNLKNPDWRPDKVNLDEKIGDTRRLLRKNWADPGLHNRVGVALARKGYLNSAGYEFRQSLLLKPDYHNAHANLADVLAKLGDINGAIVHSWEAVRLEPANTEDQRFLSAMLERKGHRIGSAPETHKPNLETKDWEYHAILAHALLETGRLDDAVAEHREAVERNPVAPHPHDDLGCALLLKGEHDAASAEFQQATKIDPGYAWGYFNLGRTLQAKGDNAGAMLAFKQAYILEPANQDFKGKAEEAK
ncbi:MAG: tetratricopeptide repeat protein [Acidobacteriia bacterium]|nr:tetratricopeptide repeat protein [Terriglobia bacterium]